MKTHPTRLLPVLLAAALLLPVLSARAQVESPPLVAATPFPADVAARVNASARGLAGLSLPGHTEPWESDPAWADYQGWIDARWGYLNRVRLNAMRAWSVSALPDLRRLPTVYYPFSGPDILYVDTLFPESKFLLMAGLEPVGTMPDLDDLRQHGALSGYLAQIKTSLYTILAAIFFKTKDMKNDFNGQVNGLVPAMAVFLAHQGYTIDSIHYVTLHDDGTLAEHAPADANGVQIAYYKDDRNNLRYALYFRTDLGNDGLKDHPGYVNLMHRLGAGVTYLKAASYLLYADYFSRMRDAILADSVGVVEDDSGLPFKAFDPTRWNVIPYGNYTGPIKLFKEHNQPDLAAFYAKNVPSPLPFGSGYKFVASDSSLLVARKK